MGRNTKKESLEIKKNFRATGNNSKCMLCTLERTIPGSHSGNLKKHMKINHPEDLEKILRKIRMENAPLVAQQNLNQFVTTTKTIQLKLSTEQMIDIYVELVTINGFPFRAVEASSLRKLFDPINKSLGLTINRRNIGDYVHKKAELFRSRIQNEVKNRMISLKVDCATRLDRSILGVNIQFEQNNVIQIRTLAVTEMHEKHTGENLRNTIISICEKYKIAIDQLYTFTTDNARNMIKASELLGIYKEDDSTDSDNEDAVNDLECFDEDDLNLAVMRTKNSILISIKCIVHTLQLAINDVLYKSQKYVKLVTRAADVVIKLRTPNILSMLKSRKLRKPIRNVVTRWSSTFKIIERLLELKSFCIDMEEIVKELHLKNADWEKLEEMHDILKYTYEATIRLQSEQLLLSEAYAIIYKCKLQLNKKKLISFANDLLTALKQRTENNFSSQLFLVQFCD